MTEKLHQQTPPPEGHPGPSPEDQEAFFRQEMAAATPEDIAGIVGLPLKATEANAFMTLHQSEEDPANPSRQLSFPQRLALRRLASHILSGDVKIIDPKPTVPKPKPEADPKPTPTPQKEPQIEFVATSLRKVPGGRRVNNQGTYLTWGERNKMRRQIKKGEPVEITRPGGKELLIFDANGDIVNNMYIHNTKGRTTDAAGEDAKIDLQTYYDNDLDLKDRGVEPLTPREAIWIDAHKRKEAIGERPAGLRGKIHTPLRLVTERFDPIRKAAIDARLRDHGRIKGTIGAVEAYHDIPTDKEMAPLHSRRTERLLDRTEARLQDPGLDPRDRARIYELVNQIETPDNKVVRRALAREELLKLVDQDIRPTWRRWAHKGVGHTKRGLKHARRAKKSRPSSPAP